MSTLPKLIEGTNLSHVWYETFESLIRHAGKKEISPLVISITQFEESNEVRKLINQSLAQHGLDSVVTVAETIFPESLYKLCDMNKAELYSEYVNILPRIKKIDPNRNGRGTYFERLIAYPGEGKTINQLDIIIDSIKLGKIKRRSKLQAAIFDPRRDHINSMFQGFPCLQHITFYKTDTNSLVLNAFYAIQWHFQRGYGNWLGLINLGKFMAKELDMEFERFNCYIGVEQLDHINIKNAKVLLKKINGIISK